VREKRAQKRGYFDRLELDFLMMPGQLRTFLIAEVPIRNAASGELRLGRAERWFEFGCAAVRDCEQRKGGWFIP
jgi:hypothetical protein